MARKLTSSSAVPGALVYCRASGPELTRNLPNRISIFLFRIEFNLYLIGQKLNHQPGILRIITKNQIQQRSKKILFRSNLAKNRNSISGVRPPRHGLFCVTEAGHANGAMSSAD